MTERGIDKDGVMHDVLVQPSTHLPGGTRCGQPFSWGPRVSNPLDLELTRAHVASRVTCMRCIAAPPGPDYNPWA